MRGRVAAQVNSKFAAGDIAGAEAASHKAKLWSWIAFGTGLVLGLGYLALYAVGVLVAKS